MCTRSTVVSDLSLSSVVACGSLNDGAYSRGAMRYIVSCLTANSINLLPHIFSERVVNMHTIDRIGIHVQVF